eukprot:SAG22_NODE_2694_length_2306_cov_1.346171_1_plen_413_part_10
MLGRLLSFDSCSVAAGLHARTLSEEVSAWSAVHLATRSTDCVHVLRLLSSARQRYFGEVTAAAQAKSQAESPANCPAAAALASALAGWMLQNSTDSTGAKKRYAQGTPAVAGSGAANDPTAVARSAAAAAAAAAAAVDYSDPRFPQHGGSLRTRSAHLITSEPELYKHVPDPHRRRNHRAPSRPHRSSSRPATERDSDRVEGSTQSANGGSDFWAALKAELSPDPIRDATVTTAAAATGTPPRSRPSTAGRRIAGASNDGARLANSSRDIKIAAASAAGNVDASPTATGLLASCTQSLDESGWRALDDDYSDALPDSPLFGGDAEPRAEGPPSHQQQQQHQQHQQQHHPPVPEDHAAVEKGLARAASLEKLLNYTPRFNLGQACRDGGLVVSSKIGKGAYGTVWSATPVRGSP